MQSVLSHTRPSTFPLLAVLFVVISVVQTSAWLSVFVTSNSWTRPRRFFASSRDDLDPERLRQEAEQLRKEIDSFERKKTDAANEQDRIVQQERLDQEAVRERYAAVVPILKPDGSTAEERCDFKPRYKGNSSYITTCEASLPLGILLGESDEFGIIVVDEVAEGGNGEAAGIQEGDLIRALTACKTDMELPTWQLLAGGIGMPKTKRFMYDADRKPLEEVMEAVGSNRMDPEQRPVFLVLERVDDPSLKFCFGAA